MDMTSARQAVVAARTAAYPTTLATTNSGRTLAGLASKGEILDKSDRDDGCCIWYTFEEPQDIEEVSIAFDRGTERTRCLDVFSNGKKIDTINSSGKTSDFEWFNIYTDETKELRFCLCDPKWNEDVWLSITDVCRCSLLNELGIRTRLRLAP